VINPAKHAPAGAIVLKKAPNNPTPPRPMGAVLTPDGTQVLVSLGRAKAIAVIDATTKKLVRTIEDVGDRPWGIDISTDGAKVYTANGPSGDVSIIDLATGKVEKKVATGGSPWGLVYKAN
jgi:YVTN family beta-propeller protein